MPQNRVAQADIVAGVVFFVLSVAIIYGAWAMDRLEMRRIHPLSAPGLLPGLLGIALAICSLLLLLRAVKARKSLADQEVETGGDLPDRGARVRLGVAAFLCLTYALGLVGRLPFWLATTIFVTTFIAVFEWKSGDRNSRLRIRLGWALFLGIATGWAVSYVFSDLFLVRLP
jgi:hypothetical protein